VSRTSPMGLRKPRQTAADVDSLMSGVSSPLIRAATRRVARRWQEEAAHGEGSGFDDVVSGVLSALARAVEQRRPTYVTEFSPHPAFLIGHRLVEMLQSELLRAWSEGPAGISPADMLDTLHALDEVRHALDRPERRQFGALLGPDGLELLVQVMHDLRSPLTSILFLAETLQRGQSGPVTELQRRQLGLIYSAGLGLSAVVSDALELARGGTELSDPEPTPFSCAELLESVAAIVRPMADEKGLEIRLVPPAVDRRIGHAGALSRALLNLLTNALKFTERGFVEISCHELTEGRVAFSVRDTGPGINPDAMSTLFEPFRRAHGRGGYAFSGTGLGLAITRKLVQAQGGRLGFETAAGAGTRFFFDLELPRHIPPVFSPRTTTNP
jgi:signal transduction histidine kinase